MTVSTSKIASRAHGAAKRKEIIDAAKSLLLERGYKGLILRDVAVRANAKLGNLHYYFPTKQELLLAVFSQVGFSYSDDINNACHSSMGREEKIEAIISVSLNEFRGTEIGLWRILIALAQHDPQAADILMQEHHRYHTCFAEALRDIEPALSKVRALHVARLFWATLDGLYLQADNARGDIIKGKRQMKDLATIVKALIE